MILPYSYYQFWSDVITKNFKEISNVVVFDSCVLNQSKHLLGEVKKFKFMRRLETSLQKKANALRISEELESGVVVGGLTGEIIAYCEMN